jgi:hypothetical protein|eukprot:g7160.t1
MTDTSFEESVNEANQIAAELDAHNEMDTAELDADIAAEEEARLAAEKAKAEEEARLAAEKAKAEEEARLALEAAARKAEEERAAQEAALKKMREEEEARRLAKLKREEEAAANAQVVVGTPVAVDGRKKSWIEEIMPDGLCCGARESGPQAEQDRAEMKALLQTARSAAYKDAGSGKYLKMKNTS